MQFNILTLFPELFPGPLAASVTGKALEKKLWSVRTVNIRDYATDNYRSVDDTPFGGGAGMVMRADILEAALLSFNKKKPSEDGGSKPARRVFMSPRGKPLTQNLVEELAREDEITILCGRYEGVDQRFLDQYNFEDISIGDYVLAGGEIPALAVMEACIRLLPGALGNAATTGEESFSEKTGGLLEYPQYTKPAIWTTCNGNILNVPEVLRSGDHGKIEKWRTAQSLEVTRRLRPDLLAQHSTDQEKEE